MNRRLCLELGSWSPQTMSSRLPDDKTGKMGSSKRQLGLLTANMSTDMFKGSKALQHLLPAAGQTREKHVLCSSIVHHCARHVP